MKKYLESETVSSGMYFGHIVFFLNYWFKHDET